MYSHVYFYYPFPSQVMENLSESLERKPRKFTIIYNNPGCHNGIMNTGKFEKLSECPNGYGLKIFAISIAVTERDPKLKLTCLSADISFGCAQDWVWTRSCLSPACRLPYLLRQVGQADRAVRSFRNLNRRH